MEEDLTSTEEDLASINRNKFLWTVKAAINLPGVRINREEFLRKELSKYYSQSIVEEAIKTNPSHAKISLKEIEKIADACINNEATRVTTISILSGLPGGIISLGAAMTDVVQYFGHIIRIAQKLIYLYGWKELYNDKEEFEEETINKIILFMAIIFEVNEKKCSLDLLCQNVAFKNKNILCEDKVKSEIRNEIIKKIKSTFGIKMSKKFLVKLLIKSLPITRGIVMGSLTYSSFRPCSLKFKNYLRGLPNANEKLKAI